MTGKGFKGYYKQIHEDISMAMYMGGKSHHEMGMHKWAKYKWKQEILREYEVVLLFGLNSTMSSSF